MFKRHLKISINKK